MPVETDFPNPTIEIIFKGLVISAIKGGNELAEIGALVASPCHRATLKVIRHAPGEEDQTIHRFDPDTRISLKVENTSRSKIETYQGQEEFIRKEGKGDKNDFRWYADVDTLHPDKQYTPKPDSIRPIFSVNSALFYTHDKTPAGMKFKKDGGAEEEFGHTALEIGANVYIDGLHSKAVLRADGEKLLTIDASDVVKGITYKIEFDCLCLQPNGEKPSESDFPAVYEAMEPDTPNNEQVEFIGPPAGIGPSANPQVFCIGVNISRLSQL